MTFKVALTGDLFTSNGTPTFGTAPIQALEECSPELSWQRVDLSGNTVPGWVVEEFDALYINTPRVDLSTFAAGPGRLKVIARHGVGFDSLDLDALNQVGVVLTNTPLAVARPVATMALTFMLALAQKLPLKDRLTRSGRWAERNDHIGMGLTGRTLGIVGVGGIGRELARLVAPFEMTVIGAGRAETNRTMGKIGAPAPDDGIKRVRLGDLLARSDFVVLACSLNESSLHLIGAPELAQMQRHAFLINVARGAVVDEKALIEALRKNRIAGAGLDVFEVEPVEPDNPLLLMEEVILAPHSLCWTDETFGNVARTAIASICDVKAGKQPRHVVNPVVLNHPRVAAWLQSSPA